MKERISQLMDGELDDKSAADLIAKLSREGEAAEAQPAIVPLPDAANDYLLAHQGFSPRVYLQGVAYVRTVAERGAEARK